MHKTNFYYFNDYYYSEDISRTVVDTEGYIYKQAGDYYGICKHFLPELGWIIIHLKSGTRVGEYYNTRTKAIIQLKSIKATPVTPANKELYITSRYREKHDLFNMLYVDSS